MSIKKKRQQKMIEILCDKKIYTQEQLTEELRKANFFITQATISRDMKELNIEKEVDANQKTRYIAPIATAARNGLEVVYYDETFCIDYVNNILVLRGTFEALRKAAVHLERERKEIVGKVMDENTMFILCRDISTAEEIICYFLRKDNQK